MTRPSSGCASASGARARAKGDGHELLLRFPVRAVRDRGIHAAGTAQGDLRAAGRAGGDHADAALVSGSASPRVARGPDRGARAAVLVDVVPGAGPRAACGRTTAGADDR